MHHPTAFTGGDGRLRPGWRAAAYMAGFIAVTQLLVGIPVGVVGGLYVAIRDGRFERAALEAILGRYEVGLVVAIAAFPLLLVMTWLFMRFVDKRTFRSVGFWWDRASIPDLLLGLLLGAGLVGAMCAICLGGGWYSAARVSSEGSALKLGAAVLFMFVGFAIAALNEEIIFRGYVQRTLDEGVGAVYAILISSVMFAIVHALNPNVTLLAVVNLFLAGVLLGTVYHRFRSIWAAWAMHFAWNFTMAPVLGVPVSGLGTPSLMKLRLTEAVLLETPDWWLVTGGPFGFEGGLASTGVMAAFVGALVIWKGRAARPPEPHPGYLAKVRVSQSETGR